MVTGGYERRLKLYVGSVQYRRAGDLGNRVEQLLLNLILEWLHLGVHRACGVARSSCGCSLLDSADVSENFDIHLHVFYLFNLVCSILLQDVLLAYMRTQVMWPGF